MTQDNCNSKLKNKEQAELLSTETLGSEFRLLKKESNKCNKKWSGDLHIAMQLLGDRLGKEGTPVQNLLVKLGSPDHQSDHSDAIKLKSGETIYIYHWRGWHDWLYFIIKEDKVMKSGWWMAFE